MDINKLLDRKQSQLRGTPDKSLPVVEAKKILNTVMDIDLERINEDTAQPRKAYNADTIKALAESIKEKGLIQPIIVKVDGSGYMIIAGHRRYKAYKLLGKQSIPCIIKSEALTDTDLTELALIENLQREDLNALEIADSLYQLRELRGINQQEIATITGYSKGNVSKYIQLFEAVKNNEKNRVRLINIGLKRGYDVFCAVKSNDTGKPPKATTEGASLHITIKNPKDTKELKTAIEKTKGFLALLEKTLAKAHKTGKK